MKSLSRDSLNRDEPDHVRVRLLDVGGKIAFGPLARQARRIIVTISWTTNARPREPDLRIKRSVAWIFCRAQLPAVLAAVLGALMLLYSTDSPAPPPPLSNCTTGTPVSLSVRFGPPPISVPVNTYLPAFTMLALDSGGNPLQNVAVTLTAPASGPSGTFNVVVGSTDTYITTPNPLSVTLNTGTTCDGAQPLYIANGTTGNYQLTASAGASSLAIPMINAAALTPTTIFDLNSKQIAHVGNAFSSFAVEVRGLPNTGIGGVPVTFTAPAGPGASATFPGGGLAATVLTNAFGRAYPPPPTANNVAGMFNLIASAGAASLPIGPFVNAAGTVTTLSRGNPSPNPSTFGQPIWFNANVEFTGFPSSGPTSSPPTYPEPTGSVLLQADGVTVATGAIGDLNFRFLACGTCPWLTVSVPIGTVTAPFGTHQLTAVYQPGQYDRSTSAPIAQTVATAFTGPTAVGGVQTMVGVTGGYVEGAWNCTLRSASWGPVSNVTTSLPDGMALPYGVFQYQIDACGYSGLIGVPPGGWHAVQMLVLQFSQPLPQNAVFMAFGPSTGNPAPHWYALPTTVTGNTMSVTLGDGDPGDDDLEINGVIAGKGAVAVIVDPAAIPATSRLALLALTAVIVLGASMVLHVSARRA